MATVKGTLKHGLKVGDVRHCDFELRDSTTADMFDAEDDAPAHKRLAFRGALLARQIVKLGEMSGPLEFSMIRKLDREDFDQLVDAQVEVDELGKSKPGG